MAKTAREMALQVLRDSRNEVYMGNYVEQPYYLPDGRLRFLQAPLNDEGRAILSKARTRH